MPAKSSGRIAKVPRKNAHTPHQKNHRWESFSTKIAKFNSLQPLRKVRRHDIEAEDLSAVTSYFRAGVDKWNELNLSKPFTTFKKEVNPLCESLPQLLHFEGRIFQLLDQYLSLHDKESLEPLLELLTAFAHDLGTRFEKYYHRSLELLLGIAGKPQSVEVVEWTFGALAFLFKYLSKLLVPDLRPTYDVVAPLLGRSRHPPHIARFAAEAISFLVKKAAAPSYRESSLKPLVQHVQQDLSAMVDDRQFLLYRDGVMTMFTEAIRGNDYAIHSVGPIVAVSLMDAIPPIEKTLSTAPVWTDTICGVLTSVTHHATVETFTELQDAILANIMAAAEVPAQPNEDWQLVPLAKVIGTVAGVRKGSRVSDWEHLIKSMVLVLETIARSKKEVNQADIHTLWNSVIVSLFMSCHHAPMDALIPCINRLVQAFRTGPLMETFIPFCAYFCKLDDRRFGILLRSEFQKFIAAHWSRGTNEEILCVVLPDMIEDRAFKPQGQADSLKLPQAWQDQIVLKFEKLEISPFPERGPYDKDPQTWRDKCLPKYSALLHLLAVTTAHPSTNARIAELLLRKLKLALRPLSSLASDEVHFIVSQGFHSYLQMSKAAGEVDTSLRPLLRAAIPRFSQSVGFLHAYLAYEQILQANPKVARQDSSSSEDSAASRADPVMGSLADNLASSSHDLRLASLQLLQQLDDSPDASSNLDLMVQIETTPLSLQHTRTIAMFLRKLGQQYVNIDAVTWLSTGMPNFAFGLLTVKLSPVWDDATETLKHMIQTRKGEDVVSEMAFKWLEAPSTRYEASQGQPFASRPVTTDFDCTAVQYLQQVAAHVQMMTENPIEVLLEHFDKRQHTETLVPGNARSKSLKVLNDMPMIAEKRSRLLVPFFLSWAREAEEPADVPFSEEADTQAVSWSLSDRKSMLGIFAQFVNPKVLYQNEEVHAALLQLLANGDVEVQKSALKAILAWKQEGVRMYQENLEYLLDEARFKNELTVFLQGDIIRPEHRQVLMPVLLRLLYGRTISKKGAASGRHGLQATRLAVIRNLSTQDMGDFLNIAVGKLRDVEVIGLTAQKKAVFETQLLSARKQVGFLNMAYPLIAELGSRVDQYMSNIVNAVLYCTVYSCKQLRAGGEELDSSRTTDGNQSQSLFKDSRTLGIKCLTALFQNGPKFQWSPYRDLILQEMVAPRLDKLAIETAQGVSGLLQLLSTWSALPNVALFLGPHDGIMPQGAMPSLNACIASDKVREEVRIFVLQIIRNLVKLATAPSTECEFNELIKEELLAPHIETILRNITLVLEATAANGDLLDACVETVLALATIAQEPLSIQAILRISSFLLKQPPRRVNPRTKGRTLLIVESFVSLPEIGADEALMEDVYETLSGLFSYFKDRENRQALSRALITVSRKDEQLLTVAHLCEDLNSFKEGRLDQPDYDRRLSAMNKVSRQHETPFTSKQWLPLLHNLVFFIRMDEEFGILSSNSADGIRRFISNTVNAQPQATKTTHEKQLETVVLPALYAGAREPSEAVRREFLRVFGFLVCSMPEWSPVSDLVGLLKDQPEDFSEPAFFFNLLSPATSKQMDSLRSLEEANRSHEMSSQNLSQFFIPILEHFIFGKEDGSDDQGLGAQAIIAIGALAKSLHWRHIRSIFQRYMSYIASRPETQKQVVRLLGRLTDAVSSSIQAKVPDAMVIDQTDANSAVPRLTQTMPQEAELTKDIIDVFLPALLKHLNQKDESEVSHRVPVGVIVVKLLKLVPSDQMNQKLAGVLTDICYILRSKAVESRDMARDTLCQIAVILGPSYFGFILRELRSALVRGYQLHVLSFTMHAMLVAILPNLTPGNLDYCLSPIVAVIMDDIFGITGQEKDAEDYTSQMKEIKTSKSQDSMELAAKNASIGQLIHLVRPLQSLLMQKVDLRVVRKIDSLMGRISSGLLQNPAAESRDALVFCYEVVQEVYASQKPEAEQKIDWRVRRYLVQRGAKKSGDRGKATKHTYKLIRFAIDILRSVLRKHDSLRTTANVSGFLAIVGDAVVDGEDEVKVAAFRLLPVIVKVPFPDEKGSDLFKVAAREATKSISNSTSTTTDLSQAALKMLAVVLRDRRDIGIKDAAIDMLLTKLKDDLTEPLYRHVTFNFLRSMLDRRIETATVYDTMDFVGTVMITNDDKDTRDLARGAFFQFIRDYPQKTARWAKQLDTIVSNLKYDREGGRLSVMEVMHLLLLKSSEDMVQDICSTCFLPLFIVLANDDSDKCKDAAAELLKEIFRRSDKEHIQGFLTLLRSWLDKDDNPAVQKLALLLAGFYFESSEGATMNQKDLKLVMSKVKSVLAADDISTVDSGLAENAIGVMRVWTTVIPDKILRPANADLWHNAARSMRHPDHGVELAAVRLVSLYLADFARSGAPKVPDEAIVGSHGLELSGDQIQELARLCLGVLNRRDIGDALASETGQILIFLGPRLPMETEAAEAGDDDEASDEEDAVEETQNRRKSLPHLFWRLSHTLRKEIPPRAEAINSKVTAMEVLETLCRRLPKERLEASLKTILTPLQNLTDPTIAPPFSMDELFKTRQEGIKTRAQILMDALQKKFGTAEYSRQLLDIREEVRAKRQQRSSKRKIEALAHPEKYGRDKRKKFEKERERKKSRSKEQNTMRSAYKRW